MGRVGGEGDRGSHDGAPSVRRLVSRPLIENLAAQSHASSPLLAALRSRVSAATGLCSFFPVRCHATDVPSWTSRDEHPAEEMGAERGPVMLEKIKRILAIGLPAEGRHPTLTRAGATGDTRGSGLGGSRLPCAPCKALDGV